MYAARKVLRKYVMQLTILQQQALGFDESALLPCPMQPQFLLHKEAVSSWLKLKQAAFDAGFDLSIISSYRSFSRQAAIWNAKASGQRLLLDANGNTLDFNALSKEQVLEAILRWSAAPGLSRHHWGCDIDVFDANAMCAKDVQLVPAEVDAGGPCAALHDWLTERIEANQSFGFFRPYRYGACKVSEEKWHLSYLPVAVQYEKSLTAQLIKTVWQQHQVALLTELEGRVLDIYNDYSRLNYAVLPLWVGEFVRKLP